MNEEAPEGTGQIEEFLITYNCEGIQRIAFTTDNLLESWNLLKAGGVDFMTPPPNTYYQMLDTRLPGYGEPIEDLKMCGTLLDSSTTKDFPRLFYKFFKRSDWPRIF